MAEAVADATVLIFLGKLRRLEWLKARYDLVLIPSVVYDEVVVRGRERAEPDATVVGGAVEAGWIEVKDANSIDAVRQFDLEPGETAVLALALKSDFDTVLVDEESVREVARLLDLRPRGTLSVLFDALEEGEIDFGGFLELLERLLDNGFYLDEAVYLRAVRQARRIANDRTT